MVPLFAVPAGPLEIVRFESPEAPRGIQTEEEEEPLRPLARLRSELQCPELCLHRSFAIRNYLLLRVLLCRPRARIQLRHARLQLRRCCPLIRRARFPVRRRCCPLKMRVLFPVRHRARRRGGWGHPGRVHARRTSISEPAAHTPRQVLPRPVAAESLPTCFERRASEKKWRG